MRLQCANDGGIFGQNDRRMEIDARNASSKQICIFDDRDRFMATLVFSELPKRASEEEEEEEMGKEEKEKWLKKMTYTRARALTHISIKRD